MVGRNGDSADLVAVGKRFCLTIQYAIPPPNFEKKKSEHPARHTHTPRVKAARTLGVLYCAMTLWPRRMLAAGICV